MNNCFSCQSEDETSLIFQTDSWKVFLHDEQSYLGRSVIVLKRHSPSLSDLTGKEWEDLHNLIKKYESILKKSFGANPFNWGCLLNDSYQKNPPNPHVHWHLRPRYDHKVTLAGKVFEDPDFGHHYNRERREKASLKMQQTIINEIKKNL